jgi:HEPN domain-containing protein
MPADPIRLAACTAWLRRAADDLRMAGFAVAADPPLAEQALFHAQQCAEKAMKAFLAWHDRRFGKTHDLVELGKACVTIDPALREAVEEAESLTSYAVAARYPDFSAAEAEHEPAAAISIAGSLLAAVTARLPAEVRPSP